MERTMRGLLAAVLLLAILLVFGASAGAESTAVAKIGNNEYSSLDEAIAQAGENDEIVLIGNASLEVGTIEKPVTIVGNGFDVTVSEQPNTEDGQLTIKDTLTFKNTHISFSNSRKWSVVMESSGVLNLLEKSVCTFEKSGIYTSPKAAIHIDDSTMLLEDMEYTSMMAEAYATLTVENNSEFIIRRPMEINGITGFDIKVSHSNFVVNNCERQGLVKCNLLLEDQAVADISNNGTGYNMFGGNTLTVKAGTVLTMNGNGSRALMTQGSATTTILVEKGGTLTVQGNGKNWLMSDSEEKYYAQKAAISIGVFGWYENYGEILLYKNDEAIFEDGANVNISDNYIRGISNFGTLSAGAGTVISNNVTLASGEGETDRRVAEGGGVYNAGTMKLTGAIVYNNHANTAGDDIYNTGTITFGSVGGDWYLDGEPDCEDQIDGWYDDSEGTRWEAHSVANRHIKEIDAGTLTGTAALKAAHGILIEENPGNPEENDFEIDKTADARLDENYQADVTLMMPSYAEELETDVVFVLDKSTSASVEETAIDMLEALQKQVEATNATVKVGVVIFNKTANTNGRLMDIATELEEIKTQIQLTISSGTNTHAGLLKGLELLNGGAAAAGRKYLIFVSDGNTYMFGAEPTAIALDMNENNWWAGPDNWGTKYGNQNPPASWSAYFAEIKKLIEADNGKYDLPYDLSGKSKKGKDENGTEIDIPVNDGENANDGRGPIYIPYAEREAHAMSIDKALYLTYEVYQAAKDAGYHVFAMAATPEKGQQYTWAPDFMRYLAGGEDVSFDSIQNDLRYVFGAGTEITDVIGFGTNEDGVEYNFDFVSSREAIVLEYGRVNEEGELTETMGYTIDKVEEIDGNTHFYFGKGKGAEGYDYAFELTYYPNGIPGPKSNQAEHFVLTFGRNIELGEQVRLTYKVELEEEYRETAPGLYDKLDTNKSAYIDPVDSEGEDGNRQFFPVPETEYENIHVEKIWAGDDDSAVRPQTIRIDLIDETGESAQTITLSQDDLTDAGTWAQDILNIRAYRWIEEAAIVPAGGGSYGQTIEQVAGDEDGRQYGFMLTNTYTEPEPTPVDPADPGITFTIRKVWDDVGNTNRPDSITVVIGRDSDSQWRTYELSYKNSSEKDKSSNTWTFRMYGWNTGHTYTVTEAEISGYASKVEVSENDPNTYIITNTYMPATGDTTPVTRYLLMIGGAALLIAAACVLRGKKQSA